MCELAYQVSIQTRSVDVKVACKAPVLEDGFHIVDVYNHFFHSFLEVNDISGRVYENHCCTLVVVLECLKAEV